MKVSVKKIHRQPNPWADCGLYALMNLYVWAGLEPPTVESIQRLAPAGTAVTTIDQLKILAELHFPAVLSFGVMSAQQSARDCFPPLIDIGCGIVFGYKHIYNGQLWGHSVVAESYTGEGITVLCSASPKNEGTIVKWIDEGPEEIDDPRDYGNRNIVPWETISYESYVGESTDPATGIARDYVIVWLILRIDPPNQ